LPLLKFQPSYFVPFNIHPLPGRAKDLLAPLYEKPHWSSTSTKLLYTKFTRERKKERKKEGMGLKKTGKGERKRERTT